MKKILLALLFIPALAMSSEGGYRLDRSPHLASDLVSLQSGARTFVNYCLNCHGAQYMRYNRLQDIGLTDQQIRDNLLFTGDKTGETMKVAMSTKDGKAWFGVPPPDLSVIARSRGADWLYTYLRTFYRDPKAASGWNNAVFPNVGMPHVLWTLQGERGYQAMETKDKAGHASVEHKWTQITPGSMNTVQYDTAVRDLVNFLVYVGEPTARTRRAVGVWVLFALGLLFVFAYALKAEYWRDVH
ncbi:MAG: cytochrome c1 [Betaproteobacteria bacterium]|nr:cytochrome c1 [Betaproteobacteria bacterium]